MSSKGRIMRSKKGFTLIELLVVIAIIALLLSIVIPSLRLAKEHAQRLTCSMNLKSLGAGLHVYVQSYDQKTPPHVHYNGNEYPNGTSTGYQPWQGYFTGLDMTEPQLRPVQLGKLFSDRIVDVAKVFYCQTAQIQIANSNPSSGLAYYTSNLVKHLPPDLSGWGVPAGEARVRSNYMYWMWHKVRLTEVSQKPLVFDSLLTVAHRKGSKPYGINALFGDGHVNMTLLNNRQALLDYIEMDRWEDKAYDGIALENALRELQP